MNVLERRIARIEQKSRSSGDRVFLFQPMAGADQDELDLFNRKIAEAKSSGSELIVFRWEDGET